ncbi:protein of unknown function [Shewanella benthica]|uniref:Uncharacterized protein n=1 Tax=Shewanella benthica TaxID=43661 RepID=A0A330M4X0_9GAMM|nr:protein of unknown function [Shewanella benthica]
MAGGAGFIVSSVTHGWGRCLFNYLVCMVFMLNCKPVTAYVTVHG